MSLIQTQPLLTAVIRSPLVNVKNVNELKIILYDSVHVCTTQVPPMWMFSVQLRECSYCEQL